MSDSPDNPSCIGGVDFDLTAAVPFSTSTRDSDNNIDNAANNSDRIYPCPEDPEKAAMFRFLGGDTAYRKLEEGGSGSSSSSNRQPSILRALISRPGLNLLKRALLIVIFFAVCAKLITFTPYSPDTSLSSWKKKPITVNDGDEHPIPRLMRQADEKWAKMLAAQPKTYAEAYHAYQKRYGMPPPRGFSFWYDYCVQNNVTYFEGFDGLMASLKPFREMGSAELRRRVDIIMAVPQDINAIWVHKKPFLTKLLQTKARIERSNGVLEMLKPVQDMFESLGGDPWMIPINELAEPRVLPIFGQETVGFTEDDFLNDKNMFHRVWEGHGYGDDSLVGSIKKACGPQSRFATLNPDFKVPSENIIHYTSNGEGFITNITEDADVCSHPVNVEYHSSFRTRHWTTRGLYPMIGYGKPSIYGEILVPTHYQFGDFDSYTLEEGADMPWDEKEDKLYWHGSPTGGGKGDTWFGSMHRHRVLQFFASPKSIITKLTGATLQNKVIKYTTNLPFSETAKLTFVRPAKNDCWFFDCKHLDKLPNSGHSPFNETWSYKYLADLDGWGYSARFLALMKSRSAVLKSTIFQEWWTERAVPWKHYIPISLSGREWGDAVTYFLGVPGTTELPPHSEEGHKLATAGRKWAESHMRKEDMTAYTLRVFLELDRLFNFNYLNGTNRDETMTLHFIRWKRINALWERREKEEAERNAKMFKDPEKVVEKMVKEAAEDEKKKKLEEERKKAEKEMLGGKKELTKGEEVRKIAEEKQKIADEEGKGAGEVKGKDKGSAEEERKKAEEEEMKVDESAVEGEGARKEAEAEDAGKGQGDKSDEDVRKNAEAKEAEKDAAAEEEEGAGSDNSQEKTIEDSEKKGDATTNLSGEDARKKAEAEDASKEPGSSSSGEDARKQAEAEDAKKEHSTPPTAPISDEEARKQAEAEDAKKESSSPPAPAEKARKEAEAADAKKLDGSSSSSPQQPPTSESSPSPSSEAEPTEISPSPIPVEEAGDSQAAVQIEEERFKDRNGESGKAKEWEKERKEKEGELEKDLDAPRKPRSERKIDERGAGAGDETD